MNCILIMAATAAVMAPPQLTLISALPVASDHYLEPSGLAIYQGKLFTISDKQDDTIFAIDLLPDKAVVKPHIAFSPPPSDFPLDFEGIACDEAGAFYLTSENAFRVLRVEPSGAGAAWVTPEAYKTGAEAGFFQARGAGIEGLAQTSPTNFVLCAERSPRGLLYIDVPSGKIAAVVCTSDSPPPEPPREQDLTDLWFEKGRIYGLQRNTETICLIERNGPVAVEKTLWSFSQTAARLAHKYRSVVFGQAEGLAMDETRVYVILDTNGASRLEDPSDRRPLLFIFERPELE